MGEVIKTDVCIIGSGPGGMLLSLLLVKEGFKVLLVDRQLEFGREFRGEFLQPGALQLMQNLGILEAIKQKGEPVKRYQILDKNKVILSFAFDELAGNFNEGINVSQTHVLQLMLDKCKEYEGFVFKPGYASSKLIEIQGDVHGVTIKSKDGKTIDVQSKLVVGADGRASHIRKLAGVPVYKHAFQMDILWTKIPKPENWEQKIEVRIHEAGYLVLMPSYPNKLQLGIDMPKGGLKMLHSQSIEELTKQLVKVIPEAEKELTQSLTSWSVFHPLSVTGALATTWYKNGLVLIGDAAHTIGPIAGQGIAQAMKDAVILTSHLRDNLSEQIVSERVLSKFQDERFDEVKALYKLQSMQERLLMAKFAGGKIYRRFVYFMMNNTPLRRKMAKNMTMRDIESQLT
ncbi:FAD-dependent monooxygenase [Metabacillus fastidiosus]|uniref:FAD-dependent monooxygenase n=1 Tax=Metabacillus fastidiosus TaxID=1458 RepID=UPI003D2779AC